MRFWLVLATVLLLAGHVGAAPIDIVDSETVACLVDGEVLVPVVEVEPPVLIAVLHTSMTSDALPPSVTPARVFRPPRVSFA